MFLFLVHFFISFILLVVAASFEAGGPDDVNIQSYPMVQGRIQGGAEPRPMLTGKRPFHGHPSIQARIIGGAETKPNQYPFQVSIFTSNRVTNDSFCGGSLIGIFHAITAAHCLNITQYELQDVRVVAGAFELPADFNKGITQSRSIANIFRHEKYFEDGNMFYYDVTIIKVKTPFYITSKVKPIQLAKRDFDPEAGFPCIVTGWGAINFTVLPKSDVRWIYPSKLQYLRVRVMLRQKCANMYNFKNLKKEIICASANVKQATGFGDSGGPLFYIESNGEPNLIGVLSSRDKDYRVIGLRPSLYGSIGALREWIDRIIARH